MDILSSYNLIIEASTIIILSFFFNEIGRKTNIPSVLMLIVLGMVLKVILTETGQKEIDFLPALEVLGIVGLIMIVLEAALELELTKEKLKPIGKALLIALIGLLLSAWAAAEILYYFIPEMTKTVAWLYATPLSILSSAIIIPSVNGLNHDKKEFHIYESTFSDILGIMLFYFLLGQIESHGESHGLIGFFGNLGLTIGISLVASYLILLIFQNIKTNVKLFLLIAVLLLLYAIGKQMHLSSLIIILIFGLIIANRQIFIRGWITRFLDVHKTENMYEGLHVVTAETAFVVRTFFFVFFGLAITLSSLMNPQVAEISILIIISIYAIRFVILRLTVGTDIIPQLFVAPRGLITVLLYYAIPKGVKVDAFSEGILLFIIIGTSLIMTFAMIYDKRRTSKAIRKAEDVEVGDMNWKAPTLKMPNEGNEIES